MPKSAKNDFNVRPILRLSQLLVRKRFFWSAALTSQFASLVIDQTNFIENLHLARLFHQLGRLASVEKLLLRVWTSRRIDGLMNDFQMNPSERAWLVAYAIFLARSVHAAPAKLAFLHDFERFNTADIKPDRIRDDIQTVLPLEDCDLIIAVFQRHQELEGYTLRLIREFDSITREEVLRALHDLISRTNEDAFVLFEVLHIGQFVQIAYNDKELYFSLPAEQLSDEQNAVAEKIFSASPVQLKKLQLQGDGPETMMEYQAFLGKDVEVATDLVCLVLRRLYCPKGPINVVMHQN